jgi:hypothetical protein
MPIEPTQPAVNSAALLRFLRMVYFILLATVGMYWFVAEMLAAGKDAQGVGGMRTWLVGVAGATAVVVLYFRFSRIPPLLVTTAQGPSSERLAQLRIFYILCFTLSEAVALYGFVLRFLGESREGVAPLFLGAVVLFVLCYPRLPTDLMSERSG